MLPKFFLMMQEAKFLIPLLYICIFGMTATLLSMAGMVKRYDWVWFTTSFVLGLALIVLGFITDDLLSIASFIIAIAILIFWILWMIKFKTWLETKMPDHKGKDG